MYTFFQKVPDFNPINPGQKASVKLPNGPTYREIILKYSANGAKANEATMIKDIERAALKINGIVRWEATGKQLVMMNKYYHESGVKDGELNIDLSRSWTRTKEAEENLCWGTRNVNSLFLEVKLSKDAVTPELTADAVITPESRDLGVIVEVHDYNYDSATDGKREISTLPTGNGSLIAMHLESADITACEVKINKVPFIEDDTDLDAYQNYLERVAKRNPQAGIVHIDALCLNRVDDSWPLEGVQSFNINPTMSAAGRIPILMETLSQPLGPARTQS